MGEKNSKFQENNSIYIKETCTLVRYNAIEKKVPGNPSGKRVVVSVVV